MSDTKQFCTFHLGNLFLGIDVACVQEVLRYQQVTEVPLTQPVVEGLINLRGQIVTAIDFRRRLEMEERPPSCEPTNVVIRTNDEVVSLLVDEIGDVLEVPDESFEPPPDQLKGIARELITGIYKLENKLLLVLDVKKTLDFNAAITMAPSSLAKT